MSQLGLHFFSSRIEQLDDRIQSRPDSPSDDLARDNLPGLSGEAKIIDIPLAMNLAVHRDGQLDFLGLGECRVRFGLDEFRQVADQKRPRARAALGTVHVPVRRPERCVLVDGQLGSPLARVGDRRDRWNSFRRFLTFKAKLFRQLSAFGNPLAAHDEVRAGRNALGPDANFDHRPATGSSRENVSARRRVAWLRLSLNGLREEGGE